MKAGQSSSGTPLVSWQDAVCPTCPVLNMIALRMFLFKKQKSFLAVDHLLLKELMLLNGSNGYSQDR